jgi:hypothetical protein
MLLSAGVIDEMEFLLIHDNSQQQHRSFKYSQVLLMIGEDIARNMER